jgi:hypothetical protein
MSAGCEYLVMSDRGYYTLPLSDDYLVLLGRQARASGGIELITKWLLRAFLNPKDVKAAAARVRDLTHHQAVQL